MQDNQGSAGDKPPEAIQPPVLLPGRYEHIKVIARGGMGMVLRAYDQQLARDVAVKLIHFEGAREPGLQERFAREAKVLASLNHPNIVKILSWGISESGDPYYVMEFLDGVPLTREIGGGKRLSAARFQQVCLSVLSGLEHAHAIGLIHRDVKPSNIMLCQDNAGNLAVKLIDFGMARVLPSADITAVALTGTGACLGSPAYMSPEQCRGEPATKLSEIYSFGCVMFECLAGSKPFQAGTTFELMSKHVSEAAPVLHGRANSPGSAALSALVDRCLKKDPGQRPQSAGEVLQEIERIFSKGEKDIGYFSPDNALVDSGRTARLAISLCLLLIAVIVCLLWFTGRSPQANSDGEKSGLDSDSRRAASLRQANVRALTDALSLVQRWQHRLTATKDEKTRAEITDLLIEKLTQAGKLQNELHQDGAAEKSILQVIELCKKLGRDGDGRRSAALGTLASWKSERGDLAGATCDLDEAEKLATEVWSQGHWRTANIIEERTYVDIKKKDFDDLDKRLDVLLAAWVEIREPQSLSAGIVPENKRGYAHVARVWKIYATLAEVKNLSADHLLKRREICKKLADWLRLHEAGVKADQILEFVRKDQEAKDHLKSGQAKIKS